MIYQELGTIKKTTGILVHWESKIVPLLWKMAWQFNIKLSAKLSNHQKYGFGVY